MNPRFWCGSASYARVATSIMTAQVGAALWDVAA